MVRIVCAKASEVGSVRIVCAKASEVGSGCYEAAVYSLCRGHKLGAKFKTGSVQDWVNYESRLVQTEQVGRLGDCVVASPRLAQKEERLMVTVEEASRTEVAAAAAAAAVTAAVEEEEKAASPAAKAVDTANIASDVAHT
jgi:hypothetical protein